MGYNRRTVTLSAPAINDPAGENAIAPDHPALPPRPLALQAGEREATTQRSAWSKVRGLVALLFVAVLVVACGPLGDDEEPTDPAATAITNATAVPSPRTAASPQVVASPTLAGAIASPRVTASPQDASPVTEPATPRPGTPTPATAGSRSTPRVSTPAIVGELRVTPAGTPEPPLVEACEPPVDLPDVVGEVERQTTETVNVRVGPGLDCDLVTQIEAGTDVTVESGPVEASDLLWVLVTVDGEQGWVAEEFVPGQEVTRGADTSLRQS